MSQYLEPLPPERPISPLIHGRAGACAYCGLPLSEFYYFCLGCGTPYKEIGAVITPSRPRELTDGELVARKAPQVAALFWSYFGVVFFAGIISGALFYEERPDLVFLICDIAVLITTFVWGGLYHRSLIVQFMQFGFDRAAAYWGLLALIPMLAINYGYTTFIRSIADVPIEIIEVRDKISDAALIITFCVLPAITEEIAYRGLMQHWLQTAISPFKAMVLASFLFAITHFTILSLPYLFAVGMLLGWTKYKTGSLYPSIAIHFLHNFVVVEYFH